MAVHYEIPEGMAAVIDGPANIIIKTGGEPIIGTPVKSRESVKSEGENDKKKAK